MNLRVCGIGWNAVYGPDYLFLCDISLVQTFEEGTEGMLISTRHWSEASFACLVSVS
jgi:hypothetical protein